jgi:hypothetical protein
MAALVMLMLGVALVASLGAWQLSEQSRSTSRAVAAELAANVLETARAVGVEGLTAQWAAGQKPPEPLARRGWRLNVRVEEDKTLAITRKVTVEVFQPDGPMSPEPLQLVGWFSARQAPITGGKP